MWTADVTPELIAGSVIAVPPMARNAQFKIDAKENAKIIKTIEAGGVTTFLYGGNAVFYHIRLTEYAEALSILQEIAAKETWIIPSVGPSYGLMMDQAHILRDYRFPTAMILPQKEIADEAGIAKGIRHFAEKFERPIVLYLKHDRWLSPSTVASLVKDGLVSWIKYAVVLEDPLKDNYLREVMDVVPASLMVSGIGEQPAIVHMRDFGVSAYTSGCVCVAPNLSRAILRAIQAKDYDAAEAIRAKFRPLEDLRNSIQPIRVLHQAVAGAGIAQTGPMLPMLGELTAQQQLEIELAAKALLAMDRAL